MQISLYVNKTGYASVGMYGRGDMMNWKLSFDEQKKLMRDVVDTETKEKLKTDFSKLDEKLESLVSAIPLAEQLPYITELEKEIIEFEKEIEEIKKDKTFGGDEDLPF